MKNKILFILWFLLLALAAVFTGSWVYAVLFLLSGLLLVCFLLLGFFCGKKVAMELKLPKAAEQETSWKGTLFLTNASWLPVFLGKGSLHWENQFTGEAGELPFSFSLGSKGKTMVQLQGKSSWCGCISFSLNSWRSYDFFGISTQKRKAELCTETVVMPYKQKTDLSFLLQEGFDMESFRYSGNRPGDDPGETFDIREYREGDSIRQIHWKLTGKLDRLMIREKSFPVDDTVLILADACLEEKDPGTAQTLAEVFSAILSSFLQQGISCQVGVYDRGTGHLLMEKLRSQEELENLLYLFLRYGGAKDHSHTITEYLQNPGNQNFANYIYLTGSLDQAALQELGARGDVTVVGCGITDLQNKGETITWTYGSQSQNKEKTAAGTCPVSCWKLS